MGKTDEKPQPNTLKNMHSCELQFSAIYDRHIGVYNHRERILCYQELERE